MSKEPETPDLKSPSTGPKTRSQRTESSGRDESQTSAQETDLQSPLITRQLEQDLEEEIIEENPSSSERSEYSESSSSSTMVNQISVGGIIITKNANPVTSLTGTLVTVKKEDRAGLDVDKKMKLFQTITRKQHTVFSELTLTIQSVKDLQENYDMALSLQTAAMHFKRYDTMDVFHVVKPIVDALGNQTGDLELNGTEAVTLNLFDRFNELTAKEVASSCMWYARWPDRNNCPWISDNLNLGYDYWQNHMSPSLWGRVLEDCHDYHGTQAISGPLVLYFMLRRLQTNSQNVVETIHNQLRKMRVDQYQGENVGELVSHVRSLLHRLHSLEKKDINDNVIVSHLPHDLGQTLINLFQTTSDKTFNEFFHQKGISCLEARITDGDKAYGDPDTLLQLANTIYQNQLASKEGWTGQFHKVNVTGFNVTSNENPCFNCGNSGHRMTDCTEPSNPDRIAKNKKAFFDAKKSGKDGKTKNPKRQSGKWPPKPSDGKKNRTKINDLWYYYHFKQKKWNKCDSQDDSLHLPHSFNVVVIRPPPTAPTPPTVPAETPPTLPAAPTRPSPSLTPALLSSVQVLSTQMNDVIRCINQGGMS